MELSLINQRAVICGSTQGIGKAIAEAFAAAGATCVLIARNAERLEAVRRSLATNAGQEHLAFTADFSDVEKVQAVAKNIADSLDIQILVNNTGGPKPGPITAAGAEDFVAAFRQHLVCNQLLTQSFLPSMQKHTYGRIINIISTSVKIPLPNLGVSNTIRASVASWAKTLSHEVGPFNITVNNILPGFTSTARLDSLIETMVTQRGLSREEVETTLQSEIPLRRFGRADELAALALFLASPFASYITGTSIPVDGGRTGSLS